MNCPVICTLFEGHYHLGAAALINSLFASGFRGRVICGVRGSFPAWREPSKSGENGVCTRDFGEGFQVLFVPVVTDVHLTNYKPAFLLDVWETFAADASKIYYIDPDIVVKCRWPILERWAEGGLALCEDVHPNLPARHPFRLGWIEWLTGRGIQIVSPERDKYYSGGFVGVPKRCEEFLTRWKEIIDQAGEAGLLSDLKQGDPTSLFHSADQDAMNMALMAVNFPINAVGPEGMDFLTGGHILSHAIGVPKPWKGGFLKRAINGFPPPAASKAFFSFVNGPIRVFDSGEHRKLIRALALASLIGRFYRRA